MIRTGQIKAGIAGGVETFSDPPIRLSRKLRQALNNLSRAKSLRAKIRILSALRPRDLRPDVPSPTEFSTGDTMGQGCERLARRLGISRADADTFALRSHMNAGKAWSEGLYQRDVIPVFVPPTFVNVAKDDGPRPNSTIEQLGKLPGAFDRDFGVNTAANSSFFTDGASALLVTDLDHALAHGLKPLARVLDYVYSGGDPLDDLLTGPAFSIPRILSQNQLGAHEVDVWEIHEAFASQVLANMKFMAKLGIDIPLDRVNTRGGSLSLGHPFGATGGRLLLTACRRLHYEDARYAVVAGCAAGGLGSAILLERMS
jgi:acetyl-CoA acyltransferase